MKFKEITECGKRLAEFRGSLKPGDEVRLASHYPHMAYLNGQIGTLRSRVSYNGWAVTVPQGPPENPGETRTFVWDHELYPTD